MGGTVTPALWEEIWKFSLCHHLVAELGFEVLWASCPRGSDPSTHLPRCVHGLTGLEDLGITSVLQALKPWKELHQGSVDILEGPSSVHECTS